MPPIDQTALRASDPPNPALGRRRPTHTTPLGPVLEAMQHIAVSIPRDVMIGRILAQPMREKITIHAVDTKSAADMAEVLDLVQLGEAPSQVQSGRIQRSYGGEVCGVTVLVLVNYPAPVQP